MRPDQVSLGVLVNAVPRDAVDEAVAVCGVGEKRSDGKLPAHVITYLTLGLALFPDDDYEEVATRVTGSLDRWGCWDAAWSVPTASAITRPANGWAATCSPSCSSAHVAPHVGRPLVLTLDLADFFPSITVARVRALFLTAGYPEEVASSSRGSAPTVCRRTSGPIRRAPSVARISGVSAVSTGNHICPRVRESPRWRTWLPSASMPGSPGLPPRWVPDTPVMPTTWHSPAAMSWRGP